MSFYKSGVTKIYLHQTILRSSLFHFLLYVAKGIKQSQTLGETDDFESNFQPCKDKPSTHAWSTVESLPSDRLLLILVHGSGPLSPTIENHHIFVVALLQHKLTSYLYERVGVYVHLLGRSVTRLTAYHIYGMWLVLSNA